MLGTMNHIALTVRDVQKSEPFYDSILKFMGYQIVEKNEIYTLWWLENAGAIEICPADPNSPNQTHDRYSPGLHHLAFNAENREQVDRFYEMLKGMGATILDPPAEYDYSPGYYAVFFTDLDGLKLEFVHMPTIPE
jgi:glyoxylase I family protein